MEPDIIACDAGSTDSGPYYLGTGRAKYAREAVKEDFRRMLKAGCDLSIPIAVGTCGTCGTDSGVDWMEDICIELCREEKLKVKLAKVYTQQSPEILKEKYKQHKISPLEAAPEIDEQVFDRCSNIVALSGAEPFMQALRNGADVILCGRATDTAIISAMPLMMGCDEAAAWHGAKTVECGSLCTTNPSGGGVFLTVDEEGFTVEPTSEDSLCTVYSVSAHMLYENADPYMLREPSGALDTSNADYTQLDDRRVRVTGSTFSHANPYTLKLEGSALAGHQTLAMVGIRDKRIMQNPEQWLSRLTDYVSHKLDKMGFPKKDYSVNFRLYGYNAVSGEHAGPGHNTSKELGLMFAATAITQELATKVAKVFNPYLLHFPVELNEQLPTYAFPFSPNEIEKGPIYEFCFNHVVEVDNPFELVRFDYRDVNPVGQEKR